MVRHIQVFSPQSEAITRLIADDVKLLDAYANRCAFDSNVFQGADGSETVARFSLPLDYINLNLRSVRFERLGAWERVDLFENSKAEKYSSWNCDG